MRAVDHPFVLIAQAISFVYLIRYFFQVRHRPFPVPLMAVTMAFLILANLIALSFGYSWYPVVNIAMWIGVALSVLVTVRYNDANPDKFSIKSESTLAGRLVGIAGVVGAIVVLYNLHQIYYERIETAVKANTVAVKAETKAKKEQAAESKKTNELIENVAQKVDSTKQTVEVVKKTANATLSNTTVTIGNQKKMLTNQGKALNVLAPKRTIIKGGDKPIVPKRKFFGIFGALGEKGKEENFDTNYIIDYNQ